MESHKLSFKNSEGLVLSAYLDVPVVAEPLTYAVFAHCFTCGKNLTAIRHISRALTRQGIAVLRFDFTGLGQSEGDFSKTNFSTNVADLIAAANYLAEHYQSPALFIGHSLGGPAAIAAASQVESSRAVVTIAAPCDPEHVTHLFHELKDVIEREGEAEASIGGKKVKIGKQLLDDLQQQSMASVITHLGKALLVCHSPLDATVGIDQAAKIYAAARHPKSFISLNDADHLLSKEKDSLYAGTVIATWVKPYIDLPLVPAESIRRKKQFVVVRTEGGSLTTEINADGHVLVADEPVAVGGNNQGPAPYELLASSLGACTAMTLQMYAKRKNMPLTSVTVYLQHNKVHAEDGADSGGKKNKIDRIEREIEISGELTEQQRQRLLEIADRCPVHRTLEGAIQIETRLLPAA